MYPLSLLNSQILDALSDHIAVVDKDGVIIYTNQSWDNFYDDDKNGLANIESGVGDNYLAVLKISAELDPEIGLIYDEIKNVISRNKNCYYKDYACHSPKKKSWYMIRVTPIGEDGEVVIAHACITERILLENNLEYEKNKFEALFSDTSICMVVLDDSFHFSQVNESFCNFIGYNPQELKKLTPKDITVSSEIGKTEVKLGNMFNGREKSKRIEKKYKRKDGEFVWGEVTNNQIKLSPDNHIYYATIVDITDRKTQEHVLKEVNEKLNFVISETNTGIWEWDIVTNKVHFSKEWGAQLGYSYDNIVQDFSFWEGLVHPDDVSVAFKRVDSYLKGETNEYDYVHRMKHKNGEWKHILTKAIVSERAEDGSPLYLIGTHTDVNKEEQYLQEISKYERYFSVSRDWMCIANLDGYFVKINPKFTKVLGYSEDDLISQPFTNFIHKDDIETTNNEVKKLAKGNDTLGFTNRYKCKNGEYKTLMWTASADPKTGLLYAAARDITERTIQENELLKTKNNLSNIVDYANVGIAYANNKTELISVNHKFAEILEYDNESQLIGQTVANFTHPEDILVDSNLLEEIKEGKRDAFEIEKRYITKNNKIKWVDLNVSAVRNESGEVENFIAMVIDITETKEHQKNLIESEKNNKDVIDSFHDVILRVNSKGIIEMLSPSVERVLGYKVSDGLNKKAIDYHVNKSDRDAYLKVIKEKGIVNSYETQLYNKNGEIIDVIANGRVYKDSYGEYGIQSVFRDVTAVKKNARIIKESEKRLKDLFQNINDVIIVTNEDGFLVSSNSKALEMFECNKEELENVKISDFVYEKDREHSNQYFKLLTEKGFYENYEGRIVSRKGKIKWVQVNSTAIYNDENKIVGSREVIRDITERKEKEEIINVLTLLSSTHGGKHYFSELSMSLSNLLNIEYVIIGLYDCDEDKIESVGYSLNGEIQENFSYPLIDTPCQIALDGEFELVESGVQKKYPKDEYLVDMKAESYMGMTLFDGDKPIGVIALLDSKPFTNIDFITSILIQTKTRTETELTRTKVENLLIEREARFRGLIENSSDVTCITNKEGVIQFMSPSVTTLMGYSIDELLESNVFDYIHPKDLEEIFTKFKIRYVEGGDGEYNIFRMKTKGGEYKHLRIMLSNHFDEPSINGFIINAQDISELIIAENERYRITLHTEEKERKRLSQDLHDGLGQTIAAASLYMNTLDDLVEGQLDAETLEIFKTGKDLVNKSAKETRMVSHNIMPPSLTQFGLSESLSEMINNYQKIKDNVDITFKSNIRKHRFTNEVELSLYRVVQELVNNALKHSKAKHINISVLIDGVSCEISVKDDGIGFDYELIKKDKAAGIGLRNIEQRIKVIEGHLEISSRDEGTEFVITLDV